MRPWFGTTSTELRSGLVETLPMTVTLTLTLTDDAPVPRR